MWAIIPFAVKNGENKSGTTYESLEIQTDQLDVLLIFQLRCYAILMLNREKTNITTNFKIVHTKDMFQNDLSTMIYQRVHNITVTANIKRST